MNYLWSCNHSYKVGAEYNSELSCSSGLEFGNTVPVSSRTRLRQKRLAPVKQENAAGCISTVNKSGTYYCVVTAVVPCQI
jgi:hypothetical protein